MRSPLEHGREEPVDYKTLLDIQSILEKLVPDVKVSTYGRFNWLKRANSLAGSGSDDPTEASKPIFQSSSKLRSGLQTQVVDKMSSDACDATLGPEFRTQRQIEFLLECFRLQQRAAETRQKLVVLQTEITRSNQGDQLNQAKMKTSRSLDLIKNNLKEVQRNLEIWLARIIGDLKGILATDGASRVREFYVARYPFVQ